jgi:hypothetical protein
MKKIITILICTFCFLEIWAQSELKLSQGLQWVSSGGVQIVLEDIRLEVNGDFMPGQSKVWIKGQGTPSQAALAGAQTLNFFDLRLSHSGGGIQLEQHINVSNKMTFSSGKLDLNGYGLDLGGSGMLTNESESSRIIGPLGGEVHAFRYLNAPTQANPGNLGLEISSSDNLDTVRISRGHEPQTIHVGQSIERYYEVSATNEPMDATFRFYYFDAELDTIQESDLGLFHSTDLGSTWTGNGMNTQVDVGNNVAEQSMIDSNGRFTLANKSLATDLDEQLSLNTWIVYPNPSSGEVVLEWELARTSDLKLSLLDLRGRIVFLKDMGSLNGAQQLRLDFSHLAEGIYNLMLEVDGNYYHRKLLIL